MNKRIRILIPIFNDWTGLLQIFKNFSELPDNSDISAEIVIINDGSPEPPPTKLECKYPVTLIHLNSNIGHQKAIACGLAEVEKMGEYDCVVIMDGDGQDNPGDILPMLDLHFKQPSVVIAAKREKRVESAAFRVGYFLFRTFFYFLSGKKLIFGNFSLLPAAVVNKLVFRNELFSHYPATVLKMSLPVHYVPFQRNQRLYGKSKMGFSRLLLHGMGAFLVFLDVISIKIVFLSMIMIAIAIPLGMIILFVKLFTTLAIPGWTSTILLILFMLFLQACLLAFFTLFLYLIAQTQKRFIPALHYSEYILKVERIEPSKT